MSVKYVSAAPRDDKWVMYIPDPHTGYPTCRQIVRSDEKPTVSDSSYYTVKKYNPLFHARDFGLTRSKYSLIYFGGSSVHKCAKCARIVPNEEAFGAPERYNYKEGEICKECWAADIIANSVYDPATNW